MQPLDIVIDTDIGDDIDDALAIALALRSPELRLCGITTVFGVAPRRAALARHLLEVFGRSDVPVAAGYSKPLLQPYNPQPGTQFEVLEDDTWQGGVHAIDFLIEAANQWSTPGSPLTIVPIGPLTNIALALTREPELAQCCRIVLMGGCWGGQEIEWNIRCDPEAAAMVFQSGVPLSMVGLDVTRRCTLNREQIAGIGKSDSEANRLLAKLVALWQRDSSHDLTLHDPLAVLSLYEDCITWQDKRIEIELCGPHRGMTRVVEGEPNARVAIDVDAARAVERFLERVAG